MHNVTEDNPGGSVLASTNNVTKELRKYRKFGNHWKRYEFARKYATDKRVLDFGCGHGFGSVILQGYSEYVGSDIDANAIKWARNNFIGFENNIKFVQPDQLDAEKGKGFDLIISFEVIEHVKDPFDYLKSLYSLLRPSGFLIISTPNGTFSNHNKSLFRSSFHIDEYNVEELNEIIENAGLEATLYKEFRKDRLDIALLSRKQERQSLTSKYEGKVNNYHLMITIFKKFLNSPFFYSISPLSSTDKAPHKYSTIIAVIEKNE